MYIHNIYNIICDIYYLIYNIYYLIYNIYYILYINILLGALTIGGGVPGPGVVMVAEGVKEVE